MNPGQTLADRSLIHPRPRPKKTSGGSAPRIPCTSPNTTAQRTIAAAPPQIGEHPHAQPAEEELLGEGAEQDDDGRVDCERCGVLGLPAVRSEPLLLAAVQERLEDAYASTSDVGHDPANPIQTQRMRKRRKPSGVAGTGKEAGDRRS